MIDGQNKIFILDGLSYYALADLPGRPYDCAFELLSAPPSRKRLIMLGFNGSSADASMTNSQSLIQDYTYPFVSGIQQGMAGKWGITHLAKRLHEIPSIFGYRWEDVIYTNALMMCSRDASSLKSEAACFNITIKELEARSMSFFEQITVPLNEPDVIVAHGNSLQFLSAASLLLRHFGNSTTLQYS